MTEVNDDLPPEVANMTAKRKGRKQKDMIQHIFTEQQLAFLHDAIRSAVQAVRMAHLKKPNEIDGEIHTRMRQILSSSRACYGGFYPRRRRDFYYHFTHEQSALIERMIRQMKDEYIKVEPAGLDALQVLLLGAKAAVSRMEQINKESDDVTKRVAAIQQILEPEGAQEQE